MLLSKADAMKAVTKKYTEKLTPYEPVKTPDGRGGNKVEYQPRTAFMGEIRKITYDDTIVTGGVSSVINRTFAVRYRTDIQKGWRVQHAGRTYDIVDIYSYGTETTILVCREVVKNG